MVDGGWWMVKTDCSASPSTTHHPPSTPCLSGTRGESMRPFLAALAVGAALAPCARAADRHFDDASLHAVQFADAKEGWAVGDEGVVWHTIDGGDTWERQTTGVRASLRSVYFLDPYRGWIAGREE